MAVENWNPQRTPPTPIAFPPHLYIPEGVPSIDIRRVCVVEPATTDALMLEFTAPPGGVTRFISYGIFNDGLYENDFEFKCRVNGSNVLPYHGNPMRGFKISIGLGPDLSNSNLIGMQVAMAPGQVIQWLVSSAATVDTIMGVRLVGYIDVAGGAFAAKFGG